ncbi:MAG TPA: hypothetical protein VI168_18395 [Croceibacterium sp.]
MSNIPSSAMPHAWAHDDADEEARGERESAPRGPSLAALAGIGALVYLFYRAVR